MSNGLHENKTVRINNVKNTSYRLVLLLKPGHKKTYSSTTTLIQAGRYSNAETSTVPSFILCTISSFAHSKTNDPIGQFKEKVVLDILIGRREFTTAG
jgi:hypothetical protein